MLYRFKGPGSKQDGASPSATLARDSKGNLYGTTGGGGVFVGGPCFLGGCGTAFKLTPNPNGRWKETVLHSFSGKGDGGHPTASLVRDAKGNLYGTAMSGGSDACDGGCGVVFKITP